MSNLQDVPLADPEVLPVDGSEVTPAPKSSSLKRFFKISKKPLMRDQVEEVSETSSQDNKELGRSNTISRFFTRLKGSSKDGQEQSSSVADAVAHEKPVPNAKPTIKTSISSYWKLLFNRQKNQRQNAGFGLSNNVQNGEVEEVHELQPVNHESETDCQASSKVEESAVEDYPTDPAQEPPNTLAKNNRASGEDLSALEGGPLSIAEAEIEDSIQPAPTFVNQYN
ncbi:uncharacterized protein LOC108031253 [Drosophila biarmipes]|uniref:uncharacterized protein LOC108031253 n=1 Tax=Drosophila biarmipes TaxID=125945 RepID=UPI0007E798CE|nr:uncharacterized protein LOC108031253 [Drosophila biarmipes]